MSNAAKIRRNISMNHDEMTVRIAEHTGTHAGGDYEEIHATIYKLDELPHSIRQMCECHGLAQKLSDCTAGMRDEKGHTTVERFGKVDELFAQMVAGDWKKKSEGAGSKLSQTVIKTKMAELGLSDEQYDLAVKMGLIKA